MKELPKNKIPITVALSLKMLSIVDDFAQKQNVSRSAYIGQALMDKIKKDMVKGG